MRAAWPPRGHRAHTAPLLTSRTSCGTITSPRAVSLDSHKFSIIVFLQRLLRMTVSRVRRLSASGTWHARRRRRLHHGLRAARACGHRHPVFFPPSRPKNSAQARRCQSRTSSPGLRVRAVKLGFGFGYTQSIPNVSNSRSRETVYRLASRHPAHTRGPHQKYVVRTCRALPRRSPLPGPLMRNAPVVDMALVAPSQPPTPPGGRPRLRRRRPAVGLASGVAARQSRG